MEEEIELPLSRVVEEALRSAEAWRAISIFAGLVIRKKEDAGRARESEAREFEPP